MQSLRSTVLSTVALGLAAVCLPLDGDAQPDPFSAYDMERNADAVEAPLPGGDARVMTSEGAFTAALGGVFNLTRTSNGQADGSERDNSTFFLNLTPSFGWFPIARLEVRVSPGVVWRDLDRGASGTATERAWLIDAGARYHLVLGPKLSVFGGLGFGGYIGESDRAVTVIERVDGEERETTVREAPDTAGFAMSGELGLSIVLDPRILLDAGVDFRWLTGSEYVDSEAESLPSSTFNTGLGLRLRYVF